MTPSEEVAFRIREIKQELLLDKASEGLDHETFEKEERREALRKELEDLLQTAYYGI